ncbi:hypothetical protein Lbir_3073 [Legionella birminghamensis]|uniref:Transmembrane protein n=1 Tax=Legionella birminghamensis TaxID=28083 RepID=A0A378IDI0_9GAMM|nr:hypothetical protein [Legionella birminghamensis]KTC66771.1 hypothetical protein Lbir_3073 [Legionella birminghamensis]STX32920.1 Uncharacterised protein [Legionella birminghamensis]
MTTGENNFFEDITFAEYGIFIWRFALAILTSSALIVALIGVILTSTPEISEHYLASWFSIFMTSYLFVFFLLSAKDSIRTIQRVLFQDNSIKIWLYFNRVKVIPLKDIVGIYEFPASWCMSLNEVFNLERKSLMVQLSNGKQYYISSNIQLFDTLKKRFNCEPLGSYKYKDFIHGGSGLLSWLLLVEAVFYGIMAILIGLSLTTSTCQTLKHFFLLVPFICFFIYEFLLGLAGCYYTLRAVHKIRLNNNQCLIHFYFRQRRLIKRNEIKSIKEFKVSSIQSRRFTFPEDKLGLLIILNNGKRYRISPNINNYDKLTKALLEDR